ncbi:MAG TPA: hypothetical protein P5186_25720 [Candidatus Paceibacterota bacterium]|nr:hypothetical protein [Verrucomicrobiota bacterium]HRY51458.1 hypothetical protein [Candidatus Paceibacterota bacterium]
MVYSLLSPIEAGEVRNFTFGTPTSVTRAGFSKVTIKDQFTPEKGFGFESTEGLLAFDRGGSEITRPKDEYTGHLATPRGGRFLLVDRKSSGGWASVTLRGGQVVGSRCGALFQ